MQNNQKNNWPKKPKNFSTPEHKSRRSLLKADASQEPELRRLLHGDEVLFSMVQEMPWFPEKLPVVNHPGVVS